MQYSVFSQGNQNCFRFQQELLTTSKEDNAKIQEVENEKKKDLKKNATKSKAKSTKAKSGAASATKSKTKKKIVEVPKETVRDETI